MSKIETDPHTNVSKEWILCDACAKPNPPVRCATCHLTYYCSEACAKSHWQVHKSHCKPHAEIRNQFTGIRAVDTTTTTDGNKTACEICQEEQISSSTFTVFKDCDHAFCFSCLVKYQSCAPPKPSKSQCPTCCMNPTTENDSVDPHFAAMNQAAIHITRATRSLLRRNKHCQLALDEIESVQDQDPSNVQAKIMYAQVLDLLNKHDLSLDLFQDALQKLQSGKVQESATSKIDALMEQVKACMIQGDTEGGERILDQIQQVRNQKYSISVSPIHDIVDLTLRIAETQQHMGDYIAAKQTYKSLLKDYVQDNNDQTKLTSSHYLQLYMGCSQCLFEEGDYNGAIEMGGAAIEMNRHYPQAHKYVVLACKAKGDISEAQKVASRAVLYETPWDERNMHQVKFLHDEIMSMTPRE